MDIIFRSTRHHLGDAQNTAFHRSMLVFESNRILLAMLRGAMRYRMEQNEDYDLGSVRGVEPWTGTILQETHLIC